VIWVVVHCGRALVAALSDGATPSRETTGDETAAGGSTLVGLNTLIRTPLEQQI